MSACNVCEARRAFLRELAKRFKDEQASFVIGERTDDPSDLAVAARQLLEAERT